MRQTLILFIALTLAWVAWIRTDFSPEKITASFPEPSTALPQEDLTGVFQQPFFFLGKGRQSFAFESSDGRYVLKFFIASYFQSPWYERWARREKERAKRQLRWFFYSKSYSLAERMLKRETALVYVHLGSTPPSLPKVQVTDRASRVFWIDLNQVPFVLQEKAEGFYKTLEAIHVKQGNEGLCYAVDDFLHFVKRRMDLGLSDKDHNIEHNFGYLANQIVQIDPGRLIERSEDASLCHEWWAGTHRLRKWLVKKHPDCVAFFDERLNDLMYEN